MSTDVAMDAVGIGQNEALIMHERSLGLQEVGGGQMVDTELRKRWRMQ